MFVRVKPSGEYQYLQVVENRWERGRPRQHVIARVGRLDRFAGSGQVDAILRSLLRFSERVKVVEGIQSGPLSPLSVRKIGPERFMGSLWSGLGLQEVFDQ
jgi:hypothetical protein